MNILSIKQIYPNNSDSPDILYLKCEPPKTYLL